MLVRMIKEKCKDAGSATLVAFESVAYATVPANIAIEFYKSESEGRDSSNLSKLKQSNHIDNCFRSTSYYHSINLWCRASKVSSLRIESEKLRWEEILMEIDD